VTRDNFGACRSRATAKPIRRDRWTDPTWSGYGRVGTSRLPTPGHRQQRREEAGGVRREELLWIGAGSAVAAQFFGDGQLDGQRPSEEGRDLLPPIYHRLVVYRTSYGLPYVEAPRPRSF